MQVTVFCDSDEIVPAVVMTIDFKSAETATPERETTALDCEQEHVGVAPALHTGALDAIITVPPAPILAPACQINARLLCAALAASDAGVTLTNSVGAATVGV